MASTRHTTCNDSNTKVLLAHRVTGGMCVQSKCTSAHQVIRYVLCPVDSSDGLESLALLLYVLIDPLLNTLHAGVVSSIS